MSSPGYKAGGVLSADHLRNLQEEVGHSLRACEKAGADHARVEGKLILIAKSIRKLVGEQIFDQKVCSGKRKAANRYGLDTVETSPAYTEAGGLGRQRNHEQSNHSSTQAESEKSVKP